VLANGSARLLHVRADHLKMAIFIGGRERVILPFQLGQIRLELHLGLGERLTVQEERSFNFRERRRLGFSAAAQGQNCHTE
jgi:hypothetical protein